MAYLLGVDLGTSGTKTVLFDENGVAISSYTGEYPLYQPQNGWAEQNPEDWWNATREGIRTVITSSGINSSDIAGIGISGQMHGLVLLDANGAVLRNSIIWCDGRTGKQCAEITKKIGAERLIEITANPALTGFTAGKILWVRENEPDVWASAEHILLPKDYIRYKLCDVFATEVSDAAGMNLLDVHTRDWSDEILNKLEIPKSMMPKVYESVEVTGNVNCNVAASLGLADGTPVVGGAGDNAAAAVGMGVVSSGKAFTTIGTSGVVFAHSDEVAIDPQGRVHTFCSAVPGKYTVMSCTLAAGLSLKWFRDTFCDSEQSVAKLVNSDVYSLMSLEAEISPVGANRLIYLPYLMGERSPILDEMSRGAFIGLSAIHTKGDMIRAVMEGVIYSQRHCLDILAEMGVAPKTMLACGGGGKSPLWRQMMADIMNCDVMTTEVDEGPALGVAILAGVGAGVYESVEKACEKIIRYKEAQPPIPNNTEKYSQVFELYKGLYPALKDTYYKLSAL